MDCSGRAAVERRRADARVWVRDPLAGARLSLRCPPRLVLLWPCLVRIWLFVCGQPPNTCLIRTLDARSLATQPKAAPRTLVIPLASAPAVFDDERSGAAQSRAQSDGTRHLRVS